MLSGSYCFFILSMLTGTTILRSNSKRSCLSILLPAWFLIIKGTGAAYQYISDLARVRNENRTRLSRLSDFVTIFVCPLLYVPRKNVSLTRRSHHSQSRAARFRHTLCTYRAFEQAWNFVVPHLLWPGPRNRDLLWRPDPFRSLQGVRGPILTLIPRGRYSPL